MYFKADLQVQRCRIYRRCQRLEIPLTHVLSLTSFCKASLRKLNFLAFPFRLSGFWHRIHIFSLHLRILLYGRGKSASPMRQAETSFKVWESCLIMTLNLLLLGLPERINICHPMKRSILSSISVISFSRGWDVCILQQPPISLLLHYLAALLFGMQ